MSSSVSRPVPAPTSTILSSPCGSQATTRGCRRSALASRSYSSGSSRYSSSQARTTSFCGSPSPRGSNRLASARVNTLKSAAVYRFRNSRAAAAGTPESPATGTAGGSGGPVPPWSGASGQVTDLSPVLLGLPDPDRPQQPVGKLRPQPLPERLGQVFGRRDAPLEPRDVGVQVAVIHVLDDLPVDDVRQRSQVQDIPAGRIDLAGHDDFQDVVVPVQ